MRKSLNIPILVLAMAITEAFHLGLTAYAVQVQTYESEQPSGSSITRTTSSQQEVSSLVAARQAIEDMQSTNPEAESTQGITRFDFSDPSTGGTGIVIYIGSPSTLIIESPIDPQETPRQTAISVMESDFVPTDSAGPIPSVFDPVSTLSPAKKGFLRLNLNALDRLPLGPSQGRFVIQIRKQLDPKDYYSLLSSFEQYSKKDNQRNSSPSANDQGFDIMQLRQVMNEFKESQKEVFETYVGETMTETTNPRDGEAASGAKMDENQAPEDAEKTEDDPETKFQERFLKRKEAFEPASLTSDASDPKHNARQKLISSLEECYTRLNNALQTMFPGETVMITKNASTEIVIFLPAGN